jgi:FdhE protein
MAMAVKTSPQIEAALKRLDGLAKGNAPMTEAAAFYRAAIPALWESQQTVPFFTMNPAEAQRKLESGRPLLVDEALPLDGQATADFFLRLCRMVERSGASSQVTAARQIRRMVAKNRLDLAELWQALAAGDRLTIERTAVRLKLDPNLLRILAQNSLKPALRTWAQHLVQLVNLDHWRRGHCPMCGSAPVLSEIQGKEGERRLRCSLCGTGWYYPRLQCPFCGLRGHKTLGYIAVEGEEEKYRLQTCDNCRQYTKVVVTFDPIQPDMLPVEELATLHLDHIAGERDFARP